MSDELRRIHLPFEDWGLVEPIVREQFGDGMPTDPDQTIFLTTLAGRNVANFVRVERLLHMVCEYTAPEYRGTPLTFDSMKAAVRMIPPGWSAIWLTDEKREQLAKHFGARDLGKWNVYRKDNV